MKTCIFYLITFTAILANFQFLEAKTASIKAYGMQVSLDVGQTSFGDSLYFTSYDAENSWPLNDSNQVSSELKSLNLGSSDYRTDYLIADSNAISEYGTVTLSIPNADFDENGVPDWLQREKRVNEVILGYSYVHYLATGAISSNASLNGKFTRSAGDSAGSYVFNYSLPGLGSATATGNWYVGFYEGLIEYSEDSYSIDASTISSSGSIVTAKGSAEYSFTDTDSLALGIINLNVDGQTVLLSIGNLTRKGNTYSGFAKAVDGEPATSWADYVDWFVEVTDLNDGDTDGVPDFTDPVEDPNQPTQIDLDGWNWYKWPWVYNQSTKGWYFYHAENVWSNNHQKWFSWDNSTSSWISQN